MISVLKVFSLHYKDGLLNAGINCWYSCSHLSGPCAFCGTGLCCRKGGSDKSNGCDGSIGGNGIHACVAKGTLLQLPKHIYSLVK